MEVSSRHTPVPTVVSIGLKKQGQSERCMICVEWLTSLLTVEGVNSRDRGSRKLRAKQHRNLDWRKVVVRHESACSNLKCAFFTVSSVAEEVNKPKSLEQGRVYTTLARWVVPNHRMELQC